MSALLGADGGTYEIPEENVAKALASGQFTQPAAAPQAAPAPIAAAAPPAEGAGAGVASGVAADDGLARTPEEAKRIALAATKPPDIQDIPLIGEDGKLYDFPDDKVSDAVATGKFRVSTLEERNAVHAEEVRAGEIERGGGTGLKPYVGGTVDAVLTGVGVHNPIFGIAEALSDKGTQETIEKGKEQVSEAEPVGYGLGAVGGEVGSALIGGEVAGGLTKAAKLTGLAKAAAEGAVYSAEPVAKAIINKDPAASAEALALGVGLNVALHGAFGAIGKLPGAAAEATEGVQGAVKNKLAPELSMEEAGNFFGRKIGLTTKQIADNRDQIVPAIKAAGILSTDTAEAAVAKIQKLEESGPAIGRAIKALDTFDGKAPIIEEHLSNAQGELRRLLPPAVLESESASAALKAGNLALKDAASSSERLAARELVTEAQSRLDAVGKLSPLAEQAFKTLDPILRQIDASATEGTFSATQALKKFVGDQTNFADNKFANGLRRQAYGIIAENVARAEDAAGAQLGSAEVVEGLRQQRGAFALSKLFGDAADKMAARQGPEHLGHLLGGPSTGSGHMLPHFVLHAFGIPAGVNAALAVTGIPQLVKSYVAKQQLRGAITKLLNESSAPATNTVVHALERQKLELSEGVKAFFGALGTREAEKPLDTSGGLRGFVPDANGRSHAQQLEGLKALVTQAHTDPAAAAARLEQVVAPLRAEGLHDVAQAYTDHQLRLLKVLQAILPDDPNALAKAHPFAAKVTADEIRPEAKARYQRALTIAADPTALLKLIHTNQITQGDVAIAAAVNPSTLQALRRELVTEGLKAKPDLSYQQRLSMGILLGEHIDQSTEQIPQLQSVYAGAAASSGGLAPHKGKLSAGSTKNLSNSSLALSQTGHSR